MVQVVFSSPWLDATETEIVSGVTFINDVPQPVTDAQAEALLKNPNFKAAAAPADFKPANFKPDPKPPAPSPEPIKPDA